MTIQQLMMAKGSLPLVLNSRANTGTSSAQNTLSTGSVSIGTATQLRYVVVAVAIGRDMGAAISISSVTVTPNTGSPVVLSQLATASYNSSHQTAFYGGYVRTGTTADITAAFSANADASIMSVWTIDNLLTATIQDSGNQIGNTSPLSVNMDCTAGGIIFGITSCGSVVSHTFGWSNISQVYDGQFDFLDATTAASQFSSAQTNLAVSCTVSPTNASGTLVSISFGPN